MKITSLLKRIIPVLIFCHISIYASETHNYGLYFKASQVDPQERTSLQLDNEEKFSAENSIISFDIFLRDDINNFGLISRFISNENETIDLFKSNKDNLIIKINDKDYTFNVKMNTWFNITFEFNSKHELNIRLNNQTQNIPLSSIKFNIFSFYFGKTPSIRGIKQISEIASFNLRELKVITKKDSFEWKLNTHNKSICYDENRKSALIIDNPKWLLDDYVIWQTILEDKSFKKANFSSIISNNQLFIINESGQIKQFDFNERKLIHTNISESNFWGENSQTFYDSIRNSFIVCNIENCSFNLFSLNDQRWQKEKFTVSDIFHSAHFFDETNQRIYLFGGYGNFRYNNTLFCYDLNTGLTYSKEITNIYPRYHSTMTLVDNMLYIFGGRGSKDGKQLVSPLSFNDLYKIDLNSFETEKCWDLGGNHDFFCAPTMYYEKKDSSFIALSGHNSGQLIQFSPQKPEIKEIGSQLGIDFNVSYSYFNIYHSKDDNNIIFACEKRFLNKNSELIIKSIKYPPLPHKSNLQQTLSIKPNETKKYIFLIFISLIITIAIYLVWKKNRKTKIIPTKSRLSNLAGAFGTESNEIVLKAMEEDFLQPNSISLFKDFMVIDKDGQVITGEFTPTLKKLFILLLIESELSPLGISSKQIDYIIWSDKIETTASNNRNVSLRKLRLILTKLEGNNSIVNKNGYLKLELDNNIRCDIWKIMKIIKLDVNKNIDIIDPNHNEILHILKQGPFLSTIQEEWLDGYKAQITDSIIEYLLEQLNLTDNSILKIQIADTLLIHDPFSEQAMQIKYNILHLLGKKGLAQESYKQFSKRYKACFGELPKINEETELTYTK